MLEILKLQKWTLPRSPGNGDALAFESLKLRDFGWNIHTGELEERLMLGLLTKTRAGYRKPTWDGAAPGARNSSGYNLLEA